MCAMFAQFLALCSLSVMCCVFECACASKQQHHHQQQPDASKMMILRARAMLFSHTTMSSQFCSFRSFSKSDRGGEATTTHSFLWDCVCHPSSSRNSPSSLSSSQHNTKFLENSLLFFPKAIADELIPKTRSSSLSQRA